MKPIFSLPQDSASVIFNLVPEYQEGDKTSSIQELIEESDGILLDAGDWDEYEICIVRPEWENTASSVDKEQLARKYGETRDLFRWQFVDDSYQNNRMLDLNEYRWRGTTVFENYDANLVARRVNKWTEIQKKDEGTPPVIVDVVNAPRDIEIICISSSDEEDEQPSARKPKEAAAKKLPAMNSTKQQHGGTGGERKPYVPFDDYEDLAILYFIDEFHRHLYLGGYETFKVMASVQIFSARTYKSLHERYRRYIRPNLHRYDIEDDMRQRFLDAEIQREKDPAKKHQRPAPFVLEVKPDWTPKFPEAGVPKAGPSARP